MALLMSIKRNVNVSPGAGTPAIYHASQGDKGTRIILGLLADNADYTIPDGTTAIIRGTRGDGTIFEEITAEVATTEIKFNLTEDMTSVPGPVECEAVMSSGSANVLGTANFIIDVEQSSIGDAPAETTDATWNWILNKLSTEQVATLGDDVIGAITTNAEDIDTLEHSVASAVNGTPVAVSLAALMTDTTKIYLYTGSEDGYTAGNWYYYDGSAWVSGGVYGTNTTGAIEIESNTDLDDLKTSGIYYSLNSTTTATILNRPTLNGSAYTGSGFVLQVFTHAPSGKIQVFTRGGNGISRQWVRAMTTGGWSNWTQLAVNDECMKITVPETALSSGDNLNNYYTPGQYRCTTNAAAATLTNCPTSIGFILDVRYNRTASYVLQTITDWIGSNVYMRYGASDGSSWGSWYQYAGTEIT